MCNFTIQLRGEKLQYTHSLLLTKNVLILLRIHTSNMAPTIPPPRKDSSIHQHSPSYDTKQTIHSRLAFIYTHQDPLYIRGNNISSNRSCCQHPCILVCHSYSPIPSADRTTITPYSPTLTWHYPQQPEAFSNPTLYSYFLSAEKSFPTHVNLSPDFST